MATKQIQVSLNRFTDRLNNEIEYVSTRLSENADEIFDVKCFCELVNMQLDALKCTFKYEMDALKGDIVREAAEKYENEEIKRLSDELMKVKALIELYHLSGLISEHISEKFKIR